MDCSVGFAFFRYVSMDLLWLATGFVASATSRCHSWGLLFQAGMKMSTFSGRWRVSKEMKTTFTFAAC